MAVLISFNKFRTTAVVPTFLHTSAAENVGLTIDTGHVILNPLRASLESVLRRAAAAMLNNPDSANSVPPSSRLLESFVLAIDLQNSTKCLKRLEYSTGPNRHGWLFHTGAQKYRTKNYSRPALLPRGKASARPKSPQAWFKIYCKFDNLNAIFSRPEGWGDVMARVLCRSAVRCF